MERMREKFDNLGLGYIRMGENGREGKDKG